LLLLPQEVLGIRPVQRFSQILKIDEILSTLVTSLLLLTRSHTFGFVHQTPFRSKVFHVGRGRRRSRVTRRQIVVGHFNHLLGKMTA
jgi:hypothetical protein